MYGGHFPPTGFLGPLEGPPVWFIDGEGREIELHTYGDGPVDEEFEALVEMYRDYDQRFRTLGIPPAGEGRIRRWLDTILADHCVLAWHGDRVVGQAVLVDDPTSDAHEFAIFLDTDYLGAGIGTRLTEALLCLGRERGVDRVWLVVERENRPAVNLYRDVGFLVTDQHGADVEMALSMDA